MPNDLLDQINPSPAPQVGSSKDLLDQINPGKSQPATDVIGQQMAAAQASTGVGSPKPVLPQPQFGTDALSGVAGAVKGIREGSGIMPGAISALNQQVNQAFNTPLGQGGPLYGTMAMMGRGAVGAAKNIGSGVQTMLQGSKANNVEQFYEGAGRGLTSAMILKGLTSPEDMVEGYGKPREIVVTPTVTGRIAQEVLPDKVAQYFKKLPKEQPPITSGIKYGGATAQVEKILNRIPGASGPLKSQYGKIQDSFNQMITDAVKNESGVKVDPADPIGALNNGAAEIQAQAKAAYKPYTDYVTNNNREMINAATKVVKSAGRQSGLTNEFYENPIAVLKQAAQDSFDKAAKGGPAAEFDLRNGQNFADKADQILNSLPPEIKASKIAGDHLWTKKSAMNDMSEFIRSHSEGVPPSEQEAGTATQKFTPKGASIAEGLSKTTDKGAKLTRLGQAFNPDVASAIAKRADTLGKAQSLGGTGLTGSGLFGTGILMRAMGGTISSGLGTAWVISKILANPGSSTAYANMLRATSLAEQDFWAKQAIQQSIGGTNGR